MLVLCPHLSLGSELENQAAFEDESLVLRKTAGQQHDANYLIQGKKGWPLVEIELTSDTEIKSTLSADLNSRYTTYKTARGVIATHFYSGENGIVLRWDLNNDGEWDARLTTDTGVHAIFESDQWVPVTKLEGLMSGKPVAEMDQDRFEYRDGKWRKLVADTPADIN